MKKLTGIGASRGVAIGRLHFFDNKVKRVWPHKAQDVDAELEQFEGARKKAIETLEGLYQRALIEVGPSESMIFRIHQMMLEDQEYIDAVQILIIEKHYAAGYAVQQAAERFTQTFARIDDAYIRERSADILDASNCILRLLCGEAANDFSGVEGQFIVAAQDLLPSETIRMDQSRSLAFITSAGSKISHSAILARTMGIPAVVGLDAQLEGLDDGGLVIVDGFEGVVVYDPDEQTYQDYLERRNAYTAYKERLKSLKGTESRTKDGVKVRVCANIGRPSDVDAVLENDGEGIGLFRSEFLFMDSAVPPTEQAQFESYRRVLERMGGKRVVIRTLDLGSDKVTPCLSLPAENNPAMGCRGIRICLRERGIFKTQLRALLRASVYGKLAIMFPMIVSADEVRAAKAVLAECQAELNQKRVAYDKDMETGIMIETPAAAVLSDELAKEADFFSIGTNDLTQYTLAVDRMNNTVGSMYQPGHPAVLRLIRMAVKSASANGIRCSICGEAACDRNLIDVFLAMGVTELSVNPSTILEVREKIQSVSLCAERERVFTRV